VRRLIKNGWFGRVTLLVMALPVAIAFVLGSRPLAAIAAIAGEGDG
jgi:hypothetical protein